MTFERSRAMGSSDNPVLVVDRSTAMEMSVFVEQDDEWEFHRFRVDATDDSFFNVALVSLVFYRFSSRRSCLLGKLRRTTRRRRAFHEHYVVFITNELPELASFGKSWVAVDDLVLLVDVRLDERPGKLSTFDRQERCEAQLSNFHFAGVGRPLFGIFANRIPTT